MGYIDQALNKIHTALESAQELSHPFSTAYALLSAALIHIIRREGKQAQEWAEKAVALSEEQGFALWLAWSIALRGSALVVQGRLEEGIAKLCHGINACQSTGTIIAQTHLHILLAEAYGRVDKIEEGLNALDAVSETVERNRGTFYDAELYRVRGELLLLQASPDEKSAEAGFIRALEISRRQEAKSLELRAAMSLSRLWNKQGRGEKAFQLLSGIYSWFSEGFDTVDFIDAKQLLDELG
jgi:predicted ATPase